MVRSMYSGVSGLRSHQTRMDTIGNNIANVNTYGFKSARTTFRDMYYQSLSAASSPTAGAGGTNPSSVGYGAKVGSVDLMMGRSTFSMTDQTMDAAIDGDGFFQVQDANGNTYYTRAGMLNFDAAGNLVDMQGNYVLGVNGDPTGKAPSSERIKVNLPAVQPAAGKVSQTINGKEFTISSSKSTTDSNINFNFTTDSSVADGEMTASISSNGIIIKMNPQNTYANEGAFNKAINDAIKKANGGKEHPAGDFSVKYSGTGTNPLNAGLTAEEICGTNFGVKAGATNFKSGVDVYGGMVPTGVGNTFSQNSALTGITNTFTAGPPDKWTVTMTYAGATYTGEVDSTRTDGGEFFLRNTAGSADANDYIVMKRPSFADISSAYSDANGGALPTGGDAFAAVAVATLGEGGVAPTATKSSASRELGLSGTSFALRGGTAGGPQTIADMTGIAIAPNGVILGYDSVGTEVTIGRIDLATFANQSGLNQSGSSNFSVSSNSGAAVLTQAGTGGAGQIVTGSLELSNVDLSREFSDMITTQRGYQANSRIITVSDTMLEELINLKR